MKEASGRWTLWQFLLINEVDWKWKRRKQSRVLIGQISMCRRAIPSPAFLTCTPAK